MIADLPWLASVAVRVPLCAAGSDRTDTTCLCIVVALERLMFALTTPFHRTVTMPQDGHFVATSQICLALIDVRVAVAPYVDVVRATEPKYAALFAEAQPEENVSCVDFSGTAVQRRPDHAEMFPRDRGCAR